MTLKQKIQKTRNIDPKLKKKVLRIFDFLSKENKQKLTSVFIAEEKYAQHCKDALAQIKTLLAKYKKKALVELEVISRKKENPEKILKEL